MAEKKTVKKETAAKTTSTKKTAVKKTASPKKVTIVFNAENVGFKAGDVYKALAAAEHPMALAEIAQAAGISEEETLLGMGWLFKEGKIIQAEDKITLA